MPVHQHVLTCGNQRGPIGVLERKQFACQDVGDDRISSHKGGGGVHHDAVNQCVSSCTQCTPIGRHDNGCELCGGTECGPTPHSQWHGCKPAAVARVDHLTRVRFRCSDRSTLLAATRAFFSCCLQPTTHAGGEAHYQSPTSLHLEVRFHDLSFHTYCPSLLHHENTARQ